MKTKATFAAIIFVVAVARAGSPSVTSMVPAAAQRGTEIEVVVKGARLDDARTLLFDQPGIEVVGMSAAEKEKFTAKLKVAHGARIGEYAFRAVTASGISDVRLFYVTPYPLLKETDEEKGDSGKTQSVPLGVTVYGNAPGEDQDRYEVDLKKGQRLSAEVVGVRLSSSQQQIFDEHRQAGRHGARNDGRLFFHAAGSRCQRDCSRGWKISGHTARGDERHAGFEQLPPAHR